MILGMSFETFTFLHVVISLVGIMTGFIVVALMLQNAPIAGWNGFLLTTTILTSVTGFFFPLKGLRPPHIVGTISLVVLAIALFALLSPPSHGPLARGLCCLRGHRALSQRLRRHRAVVRQGAYLAQACAHRLGAALRRGAGHNTDPLRRDWLPGNAALPPVAKA